MPQSLAHLKVHLVFSTGSRTPFLSDPDIRSRIHQYMHGICRRLGSPAIRINGPDDHVHMLVSLGKTQDVAGLVRDVKRFSTSWIRDELWSLDGFHWQRGYGAFSVGHREIETITAYIDKQLEHHGIFSFKDEFRRLCREVGLEIDERYVWD